MAGTDVQIPHREYFQGACIPDEYTKAIVPPKRWEKVIDGKKVSPEIIQKVLLNCQTANLDLAYVARCLGVGGFAITEYLKNKKAIPETIARKFVQLFSSDIKIPKAEPERPAIDWTFRSSKTQKPHEKGTVANLPDFDTDALTKALIVERKRRKLKLRSVALAIHSSVDNILRVENGQIAYQRGNNSLVFRLCKFYKIDVRKFELKERVDFDLYRKTIKARKDALFLTWGDMTERLNMSKSLISNLCIKPRRKSVIYLTPEMEAILKSLDIDKNDVLEKRA